MKTLKIFIILLFMTALSAAAQDFVYTPINPSFGGNPYNYSWLMNSATGQNKLQDPNRSEYNYNRDPLKDFQESLNRQILSRLSRQLVDDQFSEKSLEPGVYEMGSYVIQVSESSKGIDVSIVDHSTGGNTVVTVPYF
ncbi:curli production assembly/transport component CsgF [Prolixibacteraceae bacterium JC049]|nr:curli production assembly/transport component CsgF [Prolixibacteraceae bacterium JC049]